MTIRERMIQRVATAIVWANAPPFSRDAARRQAIAAVDALLSGSAEGKAAERFVRAVVTNLEKSA